MKLSDVFRHDSKYLEFISSYCMNELSRRTKHAFMFKEALVPISENFDSWNITAEGIRFIFDACEVYSCAEGKQEVEIPFAGLEQLLDSKSPRGAYRRGSVYSVSKRQHTNYTLMNTPQRLFANEAP